MQKNQKMELKKYPRVFFYYFAFILYFWLVKNLPRHFIGSEKIFEWVCCLGGWKRGKSKQDELKSAWKSEKLITPRRNCVLSAERWEKEHCALLHQESVSLAPNSSLSPYSIHLIHLSLSRRRSEDDLKEIGFFSLALAEAHGGECICIHHWRRCAAGAIRVMFGQWRTRENRGNSQVINLLLQSWSCQNRSLSTRWADGTARASCSRAGCCAPHKHYSSQITLGNMVLGIVNRKSQ